MFWVYFWVLKCTAKWNFLLDETGRHHIRQAHLHRRGVFVLHSSSIVDTIVVCPKSIRQSRCNCRFTYSSSIVCFVEVCFGFCYRYWRHGTLYSSQIWTIVVSVMFCIIGYRCHSCGASIRHLYWSSTVVSLMVWCVLFVLVSAEKYRSTVLVCFIRYGCYHRSIVVKYESSSWSCLFFVVFVKEISLIPLQWVPSRIRCGQVCCLAKLWHF